MIAIPGEYTCVLRWKEGEQRALASIAAPHESLLSPIIEPTPRAFLRVSDSKDAFRGVLRGIARQVGLVWATRPFFFDVHLIQGIASPLGLHPLPDLISEAKSYGLKAAPMLRLTHPAHIGRVE